MLPDFQFHIYKHQLVKITKKTVKLLSQAARGAMSSATGGVLAETKVAFDSTLNIVFSGKQEASTKLQKQKMYHFELCEHKIVSESMRDIDHCHNQD